MSELKCDRCGQDIKLGESWERDIHQVPFDPHTSQYGANQIFGGFVRHKGECPSKEVRKYLQDVEIASMGLNETSVPLMTPQPELQLLVIDLGNSCIVRAEKGNLDETFLPTLIGTYLREDLYWISKPFTELREAIEQKPVPRIERDKVGYMMLYRGGRQIGASRILEIDYEAISELVGKPLPIWKGGEWTRLNTHDWSQAKASIAEYNGEYNEHYGINTHSFEEAICPVKIWRYTR